MSDLISTERRGRILIARFSNPPFELLCDAAITELSALVDAVDQDPDIGVVVIIGTRDDRFITHYDVDELRRTAASSPSISRWQARWVLALLRPLSRVPGLRGLLARTPAAGVLQLLKFRRTFNRIGRSPAIFVAAINGDTAGGGLELSLACDLRYIAGGAAIGQPEVLLGFPPGGGGTQRLTRLIGGARALEILLTGTWLPAARARDFGIVTDVLPRADFLDNVLAIAEPLSRRYRPAVAAIKQLVLEAGSLSLEEGEAAENAVFLSLLGDEASGRSMDAYVAYLEAHDEVPAYDSSVASDLYRGEFVDMTDAMTKRAPDADH